MISPIASRLYMLTCTVTSTLWAIMVVAVFDVNQSLTSNGSMATNTLTLLSGCSSALLWGLQASYDYITFTDGHSALATLAIMSTNIWMFLGGGLAVKADRDSDIIILRFVLAVLSNILACCFLVAYTAGLQRAQDREDNGVAAVESATETDEGESELLTHASRKELHVAALMEYIGVAFVAFYGLTFIPDLREFAFGRM